MATKPTPGASDGTYGTELNAFLDVSLASDGKIVDGAVFSTSAAPTVDAGVANKLYVDGRGVLQIEVTVDSALHDLDPPTIMPDDDTIPQDTEGNEIMTVVITPTSATTTLIIESQVNFSGVGGQQAQMALFSDKDATPNALTTIANHVTANNVMQAFYIKHIMTSGTTDATTFSVRVGAPTAGSNEILINGSSTVRKMGGKANSYLIVTEIGV